MKRFVFRNGCMVDRVWADTVSEAWAVICKRWPSQWEGFTVSIDMVSKPAYCEKHGCKH